MVISTKTSSLSVIQLQSKSDLQWQRFSCTNVAEKLVLLKLIVTRIENAIRHIHVCIFVSSYAEHGSIQINNKHENIRLVLIFLGNK